MLGVGLAILGAVANVFIVLVLTLYFMASLDTVKRNLYRLAPASRRETVADLGDRILEGIGGYVSGAFIVALCAGLSTLVFLFIVGMGEYAVALALVVAVLDVIPMIGATLGAVVVCAIGLATDLKVGIACIIFYIVYQQVENYLIYPRVMSRSVDISGAMTVIAALDRRLAARRDRRAARDPHRRRDHVAGPRGVHPEAGHAVGSLLGAAAAAPRRRPQVAGRAPSDRRP